MLPRRETGGVVGIREDREQRVEVEILKRVSPLVELETRLVLLLLMLFLRHGFDGWDVVVVLIGGWWWFGVVGGGSMFRGFGGSG